MNSTLGVPYSNDYLSNISTNPTVLIVLSIVIIGYYTLFASLNVANGESVGSAAATAGTVAAAALGEYRWMTSSLKKQYGTLSLKKSLAKRHWVVCWRPFCLFVGPR